MTTKTTKTTKTTTKAKGANGKSNGSAPATKKVHLLDPEKITILPNRNPRKVGDLTDLREAIKARGAVTEAIKVEKKGKENVLVHGERRLTALKQLLKEGAKVSPYIKAEFVRIENESEALITNLISNTGLPLTPYEEGIAYKRMCDDHGFTQKQVSAMVGKSSVHVNKRIQLLNAAPELIEAVADGSVTVTAAEKIISQTKGEEDAFEQQKKLIAAEKKRASDASNDGRTKAGRKKKGDNGDKTKQRKPLGKRDLDRQLATYTGSVFELFSDEQLAETIDGEPTFARIVSRFGKSDDIIEQAAYSVGIAEGLRIAANRKRAQIKPEA